MATTSDRLGKQAREMKDDLQEMGETVRGAAEEQLAQIGEKTSEYLEEGRDKVHGLACACEQFVRQRPLRSVMAAAGIGWLVGQFWKRG
jgi:ElaB/YqjD/DUF883 family membrane-anchored ribosome-binding protein